MGNKDGISSCLYVWQKKNPSETEAWGVLSVNEFVKPWLLFVTTAVFLHAFFYIDRFC